MAEQAREPSEAEIAATVAKTLAEAKKAEAEAEAALAAAEKSRAEAADFSAHAALTDLERKESELRIVVAQHDADRADEKRRYELAGNKYHHHYLFDKPVDEGSTKACVQQLTEWERTADNEKITVELIVNSPGGGIFEGFALVDFIAGMHARGHTVNTTAYGMAASMGGVLLEIGKKRSMGKNSMLLIHEAQFGASGSFGDIEDRVKLVELMHERILELFVSRAQPINPKTTKAFITRNWKRRDWWLSATESKRLGFCDEIV